ncbi:MAG TPA: hypothetical protein RMH99_10650 [Sandaracinaceae bacterium LLY-WYZ-13_1]|nr:hypothetical protein [Sandaracinaceae bacterium LLY-WYZ-13_1]
MTHHARLPLVCASILLLACGGGGGEEQTTDGPTDTADTTGGETADPEAGDTAATEDEDAEVMAMIQSLIVAPETPWEELSHEDKGQDMVMRFEPVFRVLFEQHDPEEYGHFGCASCHGEDMEEREYAMPSPHLPPVPEPGSGAYQAMADAEPEVTAFMEEDVTPAMQTMLGNEGFTCNGCHPTL